MGQNAKLGDLPAVTVYELNDPSTAGDDMEILDQDVVHLDSTPFCAKRVVVNLDKSMFVYHACSHRVRSRTKAHPAMMVFLVVGPTSSASIDGLNVDSSVLVTGEPGVDAEIVVEGGYESAALMIPPTELMQHLRGRGRDETFQTPSGAEIWQSDRLELSELFELGKRLAETAINEPNLINDSINVRAAAHNELLECYLAAIQVGEHPEPSRTDQTAQRYSRIVRTAQEYAMEQHGVGYTITDICNVTNTSERTLQYAFRKILDMTPVEYLIRLRLHRARQNLLQENETSDSVSRVAVDWGFWHLGEFSIAYKKCFGEMPSQTLSRMPEHQ
jgi:AraC-like DNA-binding protein